MLSLALWGGCKNNKAHVEPPTFKVETITPNPTQGPVTVVVRNTIKLDYEVSVYNLTGTMVLEKKMSYGDGNCSFTLEHPGLYIVRVKAGTQNFTYKVLRQ